MTTKAKPQAKPKAKAKECTIQPALFKTIQLLRRPDDAATLTEQTGFSRPTIDNALNYGHIRDVTLDRAVIEFYKKRAAEHNEAVKEIINLLKF